MEFDNEKNVGVCLDSVIGIQTQWENESFRFIGSLHGEIRSL